MNYPIKSSIKFGFLFVLSALIFSSTAFAQDKLASYKRAKTLIGYGNYDDAMDLLRPYMEGDFGNLSLYAKYHFAQAAFQNGQIELSKSVLVPLHQEASWQRKDESRYLLGLVYFKEGNLQAALTEFEAIKDPKIFKEAENASLQSLSTASVSFLVANFSKFQRNQGYRIAMKNQLERQSILSADEKLALQQLGSTQKNDTPVTSKNPQTLDLAILLPFNHAGGSGVANLGAGNFVLEFYQGIKIALGELVKAGYKINVRTFDTQRDMSIVRGILVDPYVVEADLIIGPIYPDETELVAQFSEKHSIPFVNPLSNVADKIEGLEFAFLFRPSVASLSQGILDFARMNLQGRRIALAYSNATRDELLANAIQDQSPKLGYSVVRAEMVTPKTINTFFEKIQLNGGAIGQSDMVIILSDDPNLAQGTFGYMESKNIQTPVIVMDSWLFFNFASYEMLENQIFYFIGNNAVDFSNPNLESFRGGFYEKFVSQASSNSFLGYELLYWVAETIGPGKGFDFRKNLNQRGLQPGKITYGLNFNKSNNNLHVPVLHLENGTLIEK